MTDFTYLPEAITALRPDAEFMIEGNTLIWLDDESLKPTDEEIKNKINEIKQKKEIEANYTNCEKYILSYYPQIKQQSDIADKEYHTTLLKTMLPDINHEKIVWDKIFEFYQNNKSLSDIEEELSTNKYKESYMQLIKTGIRVYWVQLCKQELKKALSENRKPVFPDFPLK